MEEKKEEWITTEYHSFLTEAVSASLQYLHSTITWSLTITSAGLGLIISQKSFPDFKSYIFSLALLLIICHFFVRAGKAYINVVRYAAIQRYIIYHKLNCSPNNCSNGLQPIDYYIKRYHLEWRCPLNRKTVVIKLITEFGFLYFFSIAILGLIYVICKIQHSDLTISIGIVVGIISFYEIYNGLFLSPYMRETDVDNLAEKFR